MRLRFETSVLHLIAVVFRVIYDASVPSLSLRPTTKLRRAMRQLPVVNVGVIGLGADWQNRYLPSLQQMQQRLRVVAVHDDVAIRAVTAAELLNAAPILGIRELLERRDVRGFLLLGANWRADWLAHQLAQRGLPVFVGREVRLSVDQVQSWHHQSDEEGVSIVPDLPLRFLPTILRLRELIATQLGPIESISACIQLEEDEWWPLGSLTNVLDCCRALLNRRLTDIEVKSHDDPPGSARLFLTYAKRPGSKSNSADISAELKISRHWDRGTPGTSPPSIEFACEHGTVAIGGSRDLHWTTDGQTKQESLQSDRSATEVLLDLFARRVIGGLIPTPDLNDLMQAIKDANTVRDTLAERRINTNR